MSEDFNAVLSELSRELEKRASLEKTALDPTDSTYTKGMVGHTGPAQSVEQDAADLTEMSNDARHMNNKDKATKYPNPERPGVNRGSSVKTQQDMEEAEAVDKKASLLLDKISSLLDTAESRQANVTNGSNAAAGYLDELLKRAEDTLQKAKPVLDRCVKMGDCTSEQRDQILSRLSSATDVTSENLGAVSGTSGKVLDELKSAMFPHLKADNKSPEVEPQQQVHTDATEKSEMEGQDLMDVGGNAAMDKGAEEVTEEDILLLKAAAVMDLEQAHDSGNDTLIAQAKSNMMTLFQILS